MSDGWLHRCGMLCYNLQLWKTKRRQRSFVNVGCCPRIPRWAATKSTGFRFWATFWAKRMFVGFFPQGFLAANNFSSDHSQFATAFTVAQTHFYFIAEKLRRFLRRVKQLIKDNAEINS